MSTNHHERAVKRSLKWYESWDSCSQVFGCLTYFKSMLAPIFFQDGCWGYVGIYPLRSILKASKDSGRKHASNCHNLQWRVEESLWQFECEIDLKSCFAPLKSCHWSSCNELLGLQGPRWVSGVVMYPLLPPNKCFSTPPINLAETESILYITFLKHTHTHTHTPWGLFFVYF